MKSADIIAALELAGYELTTDDYDFTDIALKINPPRRQVWFWKNDSHVAGRAATRHKALQNAWKQYINSGDSK